jgi:hypothetical protein
MGAFAKQRLLAASIFHSPFSTLNSLAEELSGGFLSKNGEGKVENEECHYRVVLLSAPAANNYDSMLTAGCGFVIIRPCACDPFISPLFPAFR